MTNNAAKKSTAKKSTAKKSTAKKSDGPVARSGEITVILRQMMGGVDYDLVVPADATVNAILVGVLDSPDCPFRQIDDAGRRVQYTLVWQEGGQRSLRGSETLTEAGVSDGDHLILRSEARAGARGR